MRACFQKEVKSEPCHFSHLRSALWPAALVSVAAPARRPRADDYTILQATPKHIPALPDVERRASARFGSSIPAQVLARTIPQHVLEDAQSAGRLWVALGLDGEPVGFALAEPFAGRAHLVELDVLPEHGRRGIGAGLIAAVEQWALSQGFEELTLTTYVDFPWNADYYSKVGFEPISEGELDDAMRQLMEEEAALGIERARRVAMRKRLTAVQRAHPADTQEVD